MRMLRSLFGSAAPTRRGRRPKVGGSDMQHGKILDISAAEPAPLEPNHKMIHKPLVNHQPSTFRTLHGSTLLRPLVTPREPIFRLSELVSIRKARSMPKTFPAKASRCRGSPHKRLLPLVV